MGALGSRDLSQALAPGLCGAQALGNPIPAGLECGRAQVRPQGLLRLWPYSWPCAQGSHNRRGSGDSMGPQEEPSELCARQGLCPLHCPQLFTYLRCPTLTLSSLKEEVLWLRNWKLLADSSLAFSLLPPPRISGFISAWGALWTKPHCARANPGSAGEPYAVPGMEAGQLCARPAL